MSPFDVKWRGPLTCQGRRPLRPCFGALCWSHGIRHSLLWKSREHRCQGCLGSCSGEPRVLAAPQLWLQVLALQADMVVPRVLGQQAALTFSG